MQMQIPLFKVFMADTVPEAVSKTLMSGFITQGPRVEEYEAELKKWFGLENLLTVNSGTSALELALDLAGVKAGTTVISTPMTCSATNTAIVSRQANIVWADIDPLTGNVTAETVRQAIINSSGQPNLKAIMMVHWGGQPCDIAGINEVAHRYGLKTIEDAAHAIGATYHGQKIGNLSDFTCFSTQAIKHLTTGDGGILGCRNSEDHRVGKLLRWFGLDREGPRKDFRCELDLVRAGHKYHMTDLNASIGLENMWHLDEILVKHRRNAQRYRHAFTKVPGLIALNHTPESASWLFTLRLRNPELRQPLVEYLAAQGIQTSQVHAPNHTHTFAAAFGPKKLPGVEEFSRSQLCIPTGWWVTDHDVDLIVDHIITFMDTHS